MKTTYKKIDPPAKSKYPYYGLYSAYDLLVLFTDKGCGMIIDSGTSRCSIGSVCDTWDESLFTDFYGTITIAKD